MTMNYKFQVFTAVLMMCLYVPTLSEWKYGQVYDWGKEAPECKGKHQSPIKLYVPHMQQINGTPVLQWNGYTNVPKKMILQNNGHTLMLMGSWDVDRIPSITGGPLQGQYVFQQLHFHWGTSNCAGSEHILNGISFPLELHLVHFKKTYGNFNNAIRHKDGLLVIGVFFDIGKPGSVGIKNVLKTADQVFKIKTTVNVPPFALSSFEMVNAVQKYATYSGSLTTPPCSEIVTWIIPITVLNVTDSQMGVFRSAYFDHFDVENYRMPQPINARTVKIFT